MQPALFDMFGLPNGAGCFTPVNCMKQTCKLHNTTAVRAVVQIVAGNLLHYRTLRGRTQCELAFAVEVTQSTIGNIENLRQVPSLPLLVCFADARKMDRAKRALDRR